MFSIALTQGRYDSRGFRCVLVVSGEYLRPLGVFHVETSELEGSFWLTVNAHYLVTFPKAGHVQLTPSAPKPPPEKEKAAAAPALTSEKEKLPAPAPTSEKEDALPAPDAGSSTEPPDPQTAK